MLDSRGIKKNGLALVSGTKIVPEIVRAHSEKIRGILYSSKISTEIGENLPDVPNYSIKDSLFRELDVHGTNSPLLLIQPPEIKPLKEYHEQDPVVMLIPFQDPANVGAVIRSCAAFGIHTIVLLSEAALPFHPKSIRAGGTAIFNVRYFSGPSIYALSHFFVPVVALEKKGIDLKDFVFPVRFALLPGLEGQGIPENVRADYSVSIAIEPDVESLNAAVATSIALYAFTSKKESM